VVDGTFDEARQWRVADDLMRLEGVDTDALWMGRTEHPFTGGPGVGFVVIASHVYPDNLLSNVFSMLHEGGHTLYEQNVNPAYRFTSLKGGTSSGMHEGQSRFFENYVGRSEAFAAPLLEILKKRFPGQLGRMTPFQLYMAENCAEPCLIRCDADELTYPLHIVIRYEIEQLLFSGEASAKDIPGLWNERYKSYLGLDVPNYSSGCLQDTHWSDGDFGYFPTYALGSAFGAQLKVAMIDDGVDFDGTCAAGDLAPIREWLRTRIWTWGRARDAGELMEAACGKPFSATYFTDYLIQKFSSVYGL
jgi:carboxypeptidase Taq